MLQITPDGDRPGEPQSIAIIVRAVNRGTDERTYLPRDAFDDSFHDWLTGLLRHIHHFSGHRENTVKAQFSRLIVAFLTGVRMS